MNTLKVGLLLATLTVLFVLFGGWIGGTAGMVVAFMVAVLMNVGSYWYSDRISFLEYIDRFASSRT